MRKSHRSVAGVASFAALVPLFAAAQVQAETLDLPAVVVSASQVPLASDKVGSAVTVISGAELRANGTATVPDALRSVAGVSVNASGGRGTLTQVRLRGSEASHLLVLIDGMPANQVANGDFDFGDLAVHDIERIEVVRGPQSGIYGANAHSGVIAIVTRSGRGLAKPQLDASVEVGSARSFESALSVRGAAGPFYGALSLSRNTTDGFNLSRFGHEKDGGEATRVTFKGGVDLGGILNVEGMLRYVNRSVQYDPADSRCLSVGGFFNCTGYSPTYGMVTDGYGRNTFETLASRLAATLTLLDGRWTQTASWSRWEETTGSLSVLATPLEESRFSTSSGRDVFDYKSSFRFDSNLIGGETHTLSLKLDRQSETYRFESSFLTPFYCTTAFPCTGGGTTYERRRTGLAGEYVLDLPFALTLSSAARQDWNEGFRDAYTWRFSASQKIAATGTRIHASHGTGITNPTFDDQFGLFGYFQGNPQIKPERSLGWDIGVEQSFLEGRALIDVTWFHTRMMDEILLVSVPGTFNRTVVNSGVDTYREGIEVAATLKPTDWLSMKGTYTYTDAENNDGLQAIRRPPHAGGGEITLRGFDGKGRLTVGATVNGRMADTYFGPTSSSRVLLPGYVVVNAMASYDITPTLTAYVRGENLVNDRYEEVYSYRAPGLTVYGGLKMKLGQ